MAEPARKKRKRDNRPDGPHIEVNGKFISLAGYLNEPEPKPAPKPAPAPKSSKKPPPPLTMNLRTRAATPASPTGAVSNVQTTVLQKGPSNKGHKRQNSDAKKDGEKARKAAKRGPDGGKGAANNSDADDEETVERPVGRRTRGARKPRKH